ncbi:hypothetical protein HMPREF1531_00784 [Propionibacterium sp. oral taxon 192 str. F0372]|uniref:hypothetical protein n=1 Tax=Propionibacterium sp. oral taxon 192 TaxID=671222 RepID=UPI0003534FD3|nr:hypothetical protein [Propionibacterium sp. oral taxon 192]EPH06135.1 hypothetical protein HMPREF1531_00784 [Propionibacterium sp. oral taxon 192 str. F0372]
MMFLICGVVKPEFDVTGMISRGDDYATLASAAGAKFGATDSAISIVAAHNDGPEWECLSLPQATSPIISLD